MNKFLCPHCKSDKIERAAYSFPTFLDPKFFCNNCKKCFDIPIIKQTEKIQ